MEKCVTYNDYAQMPDDGNRYEISDGVLQMMEPAPLTKHQRILGALYAYFLEHCSQNGKFLFAPVDVILSEKNVRQPDFVFVSNKRTSIITERAVEGTPDLVVEILSPSTVKVDRTVKKEIYQRFGVKEYWIVDPIYELVEQFILIKDQFVLENIYKSDETLTTSQFSYINMPLTKIFPKGINY